MCRVVGALAAAVVQERVAVPVLEQAAVQIGEGGGGSVHGVQEQPHRVRGGGLGVAVAIPRIAVGGGDGRAGEERGRRRDRLRVHGLGGGRVQVGAVAGAGDEGVVVAGQHHPAHGGSGELDQRRQWRGREGDGAVLVVVVGHDGRGLDGVGRVLRRQLHQHLGEEPGGPVAVPIGVGGIPTLDVQILRPSQIGHLVDGDHAGHLAQVLKGQVRPHGMQAPP